VHTDTQSKDVWVVKNEGNKKKSSGRGYQPPRKNITKCIEAITRWMYSVKYKNKSIAPLYSVE